MLKDPKQKLERMWDVGENAGEVIGNGARFIGKNAVTIFTLVFVGMLMFIWAMGKTAVKTAFKVKDREQI